MTFKDLWGGKHDGNNKIETNFYKVLTTHHALSLIYIKKMKDWNVIYGRR